MTALLILDFMLPILCGALLAHLLWPDRQVRNLVLKAFLGIGLGLGLSSVFYFVYLLLFAGQGWFIFVELFLLAVLLAAVIVQGSRHQPRAAYRTPRPRVSPAQWILAATAGLIFVVSLLSTASYLLRRRQGDWDAWMMYNRAARFVYLDQAHWLQSFSAQMDPIFHADYPLLLAMNIASSWETLGTDTARVPMVQCGLFAIACMGLAVTALASVKSWGQAALGLAVLWGTPILVNEGARQMADVPLAYFILATAVLVYLYVVHRRPGLLVMAGLTAGLAAWTKNEGSLFVIAVLLGLTIAFSGKDRIRALAWSVVGLILPLAVVLYFKLALAPPSDVLSNGPARSLQQILEPARHVEIVRYVAGELVGFGNWGIVGVPVGILVILLVYYILFRAPITPGLRPAYVAGIGMLGIQALGYYGIFLITPYDLAWHLGYSTTRLILQVFPLITFLILAATMTPESVLVPVTANPEGAHHAASD